ncbi:MAG: universal stress protein [Dermatophilaceae bacterium]
MTVIAGGTCTPEGRAAVWRGAAESLLRRSRLVVVSAPDFPRGCPAEEVLALADEVERAAARLAGADLDLTQVELRTDEDFAGRLLSVAESERAEMIVIGLRRRSPVGKLLLGSHAQRVLLEAGCPVLAVKGDELAS